MSSKHGRVDLLKCLLDHGIDKDVTDKNGRSLLWWVTKSGKVDAISYLLDLGVNMSSCVSKACYEHCEQCCEDMLVLDQQEQRTQDPSMEAIRMDKLEVVQLLENHGSKTFQHFNVFRMAVISNSLTVVEYLHRKFRHPLNTNYSVSVKKSDYNHWTLLKEACHHNSIDVVEYLLEHGADLNKGDTDGCSSALLVAIQSKQENLIALLVCNGVDINFRSYDYRYGYVLPFEAAVLNDNPSDRDFFKVAEMLVVSGCSCGVFSLEEDHELKAEYINDETKNLMMKWKVQENNVKPLKQQCRRMILKHLSPRASKMIEKLPLPQCLLRSPEVTDVAEPLVVALILSPEVTDVVGPLVVALIPSPEVTDVVVPLEMALIPSPEVTDVVVPLEMALIPSPDVTDVVVPLEMALIPSPEVTDVVVSPGLALTPSPEVVVLPGLALTPAPDVIALPLKMVLILSPDVTDVVVSLVVALTPSPRVTDVVVPPGEPSGREVLSSVSLHLRDVCLLICIAGPSGGNSLRRTYCRRSIWIVPSQFFPSR